MIQSYKKRPELAENYDSIIIGSGMGGLTCGALLAKEGQKVLILERHYTAGGFTHIFKRKGFEWDVGIHYIGEVQRPNSVIRKLFDYISDNNLKWADMGEVYDRIIIGEKEYDFVKGTENFKRKLKEYFPEEAAAIDKYIDTVFKATKTSQNYYMEKAMPSLISSVAGNAMRSAYLKYSDKTTYDTIKEITDNEELIKVLCGQYGDYGMAPKESSFAMHAAVVRHYFSGGSFPIGGSSQVVETIDPVIEKAGGTILISAEVKKIIVENNKAIGVKMADGKEFKAKNIISSAGFLTTYEKLVPRNLVEKHDIKTQYQKVKRSVAHACLYIGLNGSPSELQLPKTNFWIYPDDADHDTCVNRYLEDINQPFPVVYVSFPCAKDPDWVNRYPGKSTIDIITLAPYDIFHEWNGTRWMKRGENYEKLKDSLSQRLMEALFKQLPHLRDKIEHYELSTPLTTQHFVNYEKGEIYGLDHGPQRFRQKFLKPKTPIKNFYLSGQDIVTAGVGGALFSGVLTVSAMLRKNIIKKVMTS